MPPQCDRATRSPSWSHRSGGCQPNPGTLHFVALKRRAPGEDLTRLLANDVVDLSEIDVVSVAAFADKFDEELISLGGCWLHGLSAVNEHGSVQVSDR